MDPYIVMLAGFGAIVLLTAWLPMVLKELPLSLPIFCVAAGALLAGLFDQAQAPSPQAHLKLTERLTEAVVIVALMGAGLKLDRPLAWATAGLTWRLLGVAMPLTIVAIALLAHGLLGVGLAAALLLGAALSPTDPVLASDVQVGPPGQGGEDEVRFTLTAEAGLNDGLAFPFVYLAILLATVSPADASWLEWVTLDVEWRLAAGIAVGVAVGRGLGWLTFRLPNRSKLSRTGDGFVALGITAIAYSLAEMAHSYGFLAVFVSAVAFRGFERRHHYHEKLHDFVEQIERLLMMMLLVLFGGALAEGGLLRNTDWPMVGFAALTLLVVRPLVAWISLLGRKEPTPERAIIAFFGIRGIGSVYYIAFALGRAPFEGADLLWNAVSLVILVSITLHGTTVTPIMRFIDKRRGR
ncbi:cation:proton antiporter [Reyranella sp.]|uniref:cation:proton antiporter n=1 Tax=Reyranella sp. TaxID=1929291 RepID=UPI003F6F82A8